MAARVHVWGLGAQGESEDRRKQRIETVKMQMNEQRNKRHESRYRRAPRERNG